MWAAGVSLWVLGLLAMSVMPAPVGRQGYAFNTEFAFLNTEFAFLNTHFAFLNTEFALLSLCCLCVFENNKHRLLKAPLPPPTATLVPLAQRKRKSQVTAGSEPPAFCSLVPLSVLEYPPEH